ncbi:MAG: hypothetical protein EHM24_33265, partial [Acidobacteria bacterium]
MPEWGKPHRSAGRTSKTAARAAEPAPRVHLGQPVAGPRSFGYKSLMGTPIESRALAARWYDLFSRYAEDLYPGRYSRDRCMELAEQAVEIQRLAAEKKSTVVAHNYLYPEFHEIADMVGDSLGLSFFVRDRKAARVDFESVYFMGATAKIITGDATRVFVPDSAQVLGCSLVFGTDHRWLENWKAANPGGILVTYV